MRPHFLPCDWSIVFCWFIFIFEFGAREICKKLKRLVAIFCLLLGGLVGLYKLLVLFDLTLLVCTESVLAELWLLNLE